MFQIYPTGMIAKVTLDQGPQSSRRDIPLGTLAGDGLRFFRWAHIAGASYHAGKVVTQSTTSKELATGYFASCRRQDGTRTMGAVGDAEVTLYSCLLLSANRYVDGTLHVVSGTGAGHAYGIASYQACAASKRLLVRLKTPLAARLSTNTQAVITPNPYYGLKIPTTSCLVATGTVQPMGALTGSDGAVGDSSGYQWIQVKGQGIGYTSAMVTTLGELQGVGLSGELIQSISTTSTLVGYRLVVARALQARTLAERYCAVEWLFEK